MEHQVLERSRSSKPVNDDHRSSSKARAPEQEVVVVPAAKSQPPLVHIPEGVDETSMRGRMALRRQKLGLSQGDVAKKVTFWNNKQQINKNLSRSAYCMYEGGHVEPDLDKIAAIAKVLKTTPEWLAFGVGRESTDLNIHEVALDGSGFITVKEWTLDPEWIESRFDAAPRDLAMVTVNDFTPHLKPGDLAVVRRRAKPTAAGGEFAFGHQDEMKVAHVTRPNATGPYRVYDADLRHFEEVPADDLLFLGKVVGKLGDC